MYISREQDGKLKCAYVRIAFRDAPILLESFLVRYEGKGKEQNASIYNCSKFEQTALR